MEAERVLVGRSVDRVRGELRFREIDIAQSQALGARGGVGDKSGDRAFLRFYTPRGRKRLNIRTDLRVICILMKTFLTLAVAVITMAAFSSTTFAEGSGCGGCPVSGEKAKDKAKAEDGAQS